MNELELKRIQMAKSQKFNMDYKKSFQKGTVCFYLYKVSIYIKF